jgi:signal transduction histidine kinase
MLTHIGQLPVDCAMGGTDRAGDLGPMPLPRKQEPNGWRRRSQELARPGAADLVAQIRREQVSYLTRGSVLSFLVHPLAAALVALALFGHASHEMIAAWLLSVWTVAAVRGVHWHHYRDRLGSLSEATRRAAFLTGIAAGSNLMWGAAPLLLWPADASGPQVLLFVAIAAVMAMEMVTLASFMLAVLGSLGVSLVALLVALIWHGLLTPPILCALLLYASVMAIGTFHINRLLFESLRLRFELGAASTAAQAASKAKSDFIANMSHELRTPLNAIIGFSEMLSKEGSLMIGPERRHEYARLINDSGHHLLSVVNGILDMSKIETGNFEIMPEPFAPEYVIGDGCDMLALKAREAGIELAVRLPEKLPQVVADKRALSQIMLNLLANAIKFSNRGGRITVSAKAQDAAIVVTVEDNGVGIDAEDLPRVGDPFFQARSSYDRRHDGTGLSIVKGLLALHGGRIEIMSRLGEGTRVTFHLPVNCESARCGEASVIERLVRRGAEEPASTLVKKSA